jgi:hypothetical protein
LDMRHRETGGPCVPPPRTQLSAAADNRITEEATLCPNSIWLLSPGWWYAWASGFPVAHVQSAWATEMETTDGDVGSCPGVSETLHGRCTGFNVHNASRFDLSVKRLEHCTPQVPVPASSCNTRGLSNRLIKMPRHIALHRCATRFIAQ